MHQSFRFTIVFLFDKINKIKHFDYHVNSDKCSVSIACPISCVLLNVIKRLFDLDLEIPPRRRHRRPLRLIRIVELPRIIMVNNTIINVVVTITRRFSSSNAKCSANAKKLPAINANVRNVCCIVICVTANNANEAPINAEPKNTIKKRTNPLKMAAEPDTIPPPMMNAEIEVPIIANTKIEPIF
ncbi:hypothetical protein DERP_004695 [Dermatophagoides pteronyssinus]|uniref:Uncharacterized protein n=1 Tax=Dermatophagoides pteronyssinus TaxID=6956 RepID=A0ABQ8JQ75_DERPT|nr:hypothetical protein DERP_004695 [Dermatophagoides pteronyssinus]